MTGVTASVVTFVVMKIIIPEFLKREKEKKILSRKRHFKYSHTNFWSKTMEDGTVEFWAYSCIEDESWYLGMFNGERIVECDGFYAHTLSWSVQKGAQKLFEDFDME